MAANTDVIATGAVDLELEAKRKDSSWQPCQVYFSSIGGGLIVKYEDNGSQDTLMSEKEALKRIRARSLPLQHDDCAQIKPGETVLVNRDSESELGSFFDAEVEKVVRVRHSKRANYRCSFKIRWLNQDANDGSLTVPSCSVMRLANKSIKNHPTISAFIESVQLSNSSDSDISPQMDIVSDFDLDLHNLLERQIEGIRNSVHGSKKRIRDEISVFEDISKPNGRTPNVEISTEKSRTRRSTRSQRSKKQESPVIPPPIEENLSDKKSPLNPLAARAALASLMSHKSLEKSIDLKETKTFKSSETEYSPNPDKIVKKLFSTSSSIDMLEDDDDDSDDDDRMNDTETVTRSTLVKIQKVKVNGVISDNKVSTNKRRTRSTINKEEEIETIEVTTKKDTTYHVQKDKNTLFATSSSNGVKNSSNGKRRTRSVLNNEVSETAEEIETESTVGPTEQNNKKSRNVMSNGGHGFGAKKGLVDLKAQKWARQLEKKVSNQDTFSDNIRYPISMGLTLALNLEDQETRLSQMMMRSPQMNSQV
ncbi:hypothetical protein LXL04_018483 [Taraxacum kok-saghyz]